MPRSRPLLPHVFPFIPLQAHRSASVEKERSRDFYNLCEPNVAFKASMRNRRVFPTCVVEMTQPEPQEETQVKAVLAAVFTTRRVRRNTQPNSKLLCESETTPLTVLFISLFLSVFKYFINISFSIVRLEAAKKNSVCS